MTKTKYSGLRTAILNTLSRDQLRDVCRHGAGHGLPGFSYSSECSAFFNTHRKEILELVEDEGKKCGWELLDMITDLKGLEGMSEEQISDAITLGKGDHRNTILDTIVWFVIETIAANEVGPKNVPKAQCQCCGASPKNWPLWADYRLFHILEDNPSPGTQHKVGAALITTAPADKVARVCIQARKGPISTTNWLFIESELHRLGFFAVVAKWEVRFL